MIALCVILFSLLTLGQSRNPCCSNPCQHRGICVTKGFDRYECDCTRTGYYGTNCNTPRAHLIESPPTYNSEFSYKSWEVYSNLSYYARSLPPVPRDCPTPLGMTGRKEFPDSKLIVEKLLLRRKFIPDPQGTNLMFAFFAQHFTHQFFKTDHHKGPAFTKAVGHGVDLNHVYGTTLERQRKLRLFKNGKLKYQMINGEMYPLTVKETQAEMSYPPHVPEHLKFAVGHEVFGLVPGLMMYAILWFREHNRVCDILVKEHPEWEDEQLFQTTRLILIGETIKIVIEDYVQHLSGYYFKLKFDPELLFTQQFQYQNRIAAEFNTLYHWHSLLPDSFEIQDQEYSYQQFMFNNSILLDHGLSQVVRSFTRQRAGRISGGWNIPAEVQAVAKASIDQSRQMRYQSLNAYREHFLLKPFKSFEELTGDKVLAAELEELYGDIDAVELYPGLIVEKPHHNAIFGETMIELGAPFSLKGLMGNAICSPEYWKPSTFGGKVGFDIINTATLQKFICNNAKGCPLTAFHVINPKTVTMNSSSSSTERGDLSSAVLLKKQYSEL